MQEIPPDAPTAQLRPAGRARPPRLMICEDESLLAIDLQALVESAGAEVCAMAMSQADAMSILETVEPDLVLLDLELNDGACVKVAERLTARGIPFVILTGFDAPGQVPPAFAGAPWLLKPVAEGELMRTITELLDRPSRAEAS